MRDRFEKHIGTKAKGTVIGTLLIFMIVAPVVSGYEHLDHRFSATESWYEYKDPFVSPIAPSFTVGEAPRFGSHTEYYRTIGIRWEDTLSCYHPGVGTRKYDTQYWPKQPGEFETKIAGTVTNSFLPGDDGFWDYNEEEIDPAAISCQMCGVVRSRTSLGYEKEPWSYCTDWFDVNQEIN